MSRVKGVVVSTTYEPGKRQPLDARMLVTKYEDLINPDIWKPLNHDVQLCYNGMITAVNNDAKEYNGIYFLTDYTKITDKNYREYIVAKLNNEVTSKYFSMWKKLSTTVENIDMSQYITVSDLRQEVADQVAHFMPEYDIINGGSAKL